MFMPFYFFCNNAANRYIVVFFTQSLKLFYASGFMPNRNTAFLCSALDFLAYLFNFFIANNRINIQFKEVLHIILIDELYVPLNIIININVSFTVEKRKRSAIKHKVLDVFNLFSLPRLHVVMRFKHKAQFIKTIFKQFNS